MHDIAQIIVARPMVGVGMAILVLLVLHNLRRGQTRVALVLVGFILLFLLFLQTKVIPVEVPEVAEDELVLPPAVEP